MFTKKDLNANYMVKTREGKVGVVLHPDDKFMISFQLGGCVDLDDYNDNFEHNSKKSLDIMCIKDHEGYPNIANFDTMRVAWDRNEINKVFLNIGDIIEMISGDKYIVARPKNSSMVLVALNYDAVIPDISTLNISKVKTIYVPRKPIDYHESPQSVGAYKYNRNDLLYYPMLLEAVEEGE